MYAQKSTSRQSILLTSSRLANQLDDTNTLINATSNIISSRRSSSRALSPNHFLPNVNKSVNTSLNMNTSTVRPTTPKEVKFPKEQTASTQSINKNVEKLPDLVSKNVNRDSQNLSSLSETILIQSRQEGHSQNESFTFERDENKKELNEKTRVGILRGFYNFNLSLFDLINICLNLIFVLSFVKLR